MYIMDLHCDALYKLAEAQGKLSYSDAPELETNAARLQEGQVRMQGFAIFVDPALPDPLRFQNCLDQVHYFYEEVLDKHPQMVHITQWQQIAQLQPGQIGALLTLEGVDPIGNDLKKMNILYRLGVRSVGLTWNFANLAADGALEERGAGLTAFGHELVQFYNKHQILTDVSHLCERSFWDVLEVADYPFASHSNARAILDHPRNLTDEQATAMFKRNAMIHVVYCPYFIKEGEQVTVTDLLRHIDHFCSLGGVKHIGLGSDFDGISEHVQGLEHAGKSQHVINELLKHYSEEQVRGFAHENFIQHLPK
ncbi:dipeptidase [Paenibacillus kandeliae]|uniref:dipeptidase n=1 Tax=Paenibacillus kandeliae TaxID=3231269 RepID=UPI00345B46FD